MDSLFDLITDDALSWFDPFTNEVSFIGSESHLSNLAA